MPYALYMCSFHTCSRLHRDELRLYAIYLAIYHEKHLTKKKLPISSLSSWIDFHVTFEPYTNAIAILQPMISCMWLQYPVSRMHVYNTHMSVCVYVNVVGVVIWMGMEAERKLSKINGIYKPYAY